jgi:predicted metalloprotease with PDZ domain
LPPFRAAPEAEVREMFGSVTRSATASVRRAGLLGAVALLLAQAAAAQAPIEYRLSFPAPAHHWAEIQVTFTGLADAPLHARMSRSSPGRYAVHEFAKNVYDVHAFDGAGRELTASRPDPAAWDVQGHDGTVRLTYKIYGNTVDGTYLAIDTTHAHINMPATLMWGRGLEDRPVRLQIVPPPALGWTAATQLFPTSDPWTFTAPNLQYLMDSPIELSAQAIRTFTVRNPEGRELTIRAAVHSDATAADVDAYAAAVETIVREEGAIYGEFPEYETGRYTFLADYVPWGGGDGMEHRNSTVVSSATSLRAGPARVLPTVAHEFFHGWNVERIRPASLEPFDFTRANISGELWLAEGFTQYYGGLVMQRTGLASLDATVRTIGNTVDAVLNDPGRRLNSAVDMSRLAPFSDAATSIDRTNLSNTFISYYTYGSAVALALDLSLRERSNGRISLDDYMRALWRKYGRPGGPQPGLVANPYTLRDARATLAEVAGDAAFADAFFDRYVEGRDVADYARLLQQAGLVLRKRNPDAAWLGPVTLDPSGRVSSLVQPGTPAIDAGFDQDDVITAVDGKRPAGASTLESIVRTHKPGDRVTIAFTHPDGTPGSGVVTLAEDPSVEAVTLESTGGVPTAAQQAFRAAWLGSKRAQP